MDNLTHSLVGLVAAKAGLERVSPYATPLCVVAANLPDADIVALVGGGTTYLEHHRGITHSILGTLVLGLALPLVFVACERVLARWRGREPRARAGGLLIASLLLTASHPLLDWTNSYGLRPLLPWSGQWYYGDLVFVIDPWLWLLLGGTCFLLTSGTPRRLLLWSLLAAAVAAGVLLAPQQRGFEVPQAAKMLWAACLLSAALARWLGVGTRRGRALAVAALVVVVVYWGALAVVHARARRVAETVAHRVAAEDGERVLKVAAMPTLLNPFRWACVAETEGSTHRYELGPRALFDESPDFHTRQFDKPRGESLVAVERAAEDRRARVLLDFARFPVAQVWPAPTGGSVVRLTDVRFGEPAPPGARASGAFTVEIHVPAP